MSATDSTMWTGLLHGGLAGTFLRVPFVPPQADAVRASGAKAAIYGLPFDGTNISRTGANGGPRQMRDVSCMTTTYHAMFDFDLVEESRLVDCGDCSVVLGSAAKTFERAQADISQIVAGGAMPVVLGGEHSVTIPAVNAIREHVADPGLVLIDTHLDTAQDVGGELLTHCAPISRAVDAGFDPRKMALIGISGWLNPRAELDYCRERGITVIWLEEIWEHGTRWAVDRALEVAGAGDGIYLSFDIDSLDAAHAVGTCCPTPGGLSSREAIELTRGVAAAGLIGVDVVEIAPTLDPTPASALMGNRIAMEAVAFANGCGR
ncbi:MAG: guanidinobutyrase [Gaiellaceae bacterium]|nr:guanidinobutyrase [Gaiellaceae bacterium]